MNNTYRLGRLFSISGYAFGIIFAFLDKLYIKQGQFFIIDFVILGLLAVNFVVLERMGRYITVYQYGIYQFFSFLALSLGTGLIMVSYKAFFVVLFFNGIFQFLYFNSKLYLKQIPLLALAITIIAIIYLAVEKWDSSFLSFLVLGVLTIVLYLVGYFGVRYVEIILERHNEQSLSLNDMLKVVEEKAEEAKQGTKAKSAFLASMSHEIRTPINAFIGMNEMVLRESSDPKIRAYAEDARSAENHLLMLINDILDFSKMESGKMDIVSVEYDTRSNLHDLYVMFAAKIREKNIEFVCDIDSEIPSRLVGDDVRIKQVLTNLLSNAFKYTNEGKITFSVKQLSIDEKRSVLEYSVKDTGVGIRDEDMDKLFEAFRRIGENSNNRYVQGTGLGISITCSLLELMGSHLEVKSVYGEGSEFSFQLSQNVASDEKLGEFAKNIDDNPEKINLVSALEAENIRILVVDDNPMNITVFKNYVKYDGITVDHAENGYDCCEIVKKHRYDLIFMDHMMPGMDGVETFRKLQSMSDNMSADTPVIMLTATATAHIRDKFMGYGFADYLSKPVDSSRLLSKIAEFLPDKAKLVKVEAGGEAPPDCTGIPIVDGMDEKFAQMHFATREQLIESIRIFISLSESDKDQLEGFYREGVVNGDFTEYRTKVHSMKSSAAMIGIIPLAGMAKVLENAAASEDRDTIDKLHEVFLDNWVHFTGLLDVFEEKDQNSSKQSASENISAIDDLLTIMKCSAEEVELDALDDMMNMLEGYEYQGEMKQFMKKLASVVKLFDTDSIVSLINEYFSMKTG